MIVVQVAGRLGKDAEIRFSANGQKMISLNLATNVRKNGKEETVWWRVTGWGDRFEKILPYLKKGSAVFVIGEMGKPEVWTDKEGRSQVSLDIWVEVIKLNPFGGSQDRSQEAAAAAAAAAGAAAGAPTGAAVHTAANAANYGAASGSYGNLQQSGQGYAQSSGYERDGFNDFSGGGLSHDSQEAEEPIPF